MDLHARRFPPEGRADRLSPAVTAQWTDFVLRAARLVEPEGRPCSYRSWTLALAEAADRKRSAPPGANDIAIRLMDFAEDVAQPAWPEPRPDLVAFAIAFVEADVMLFRSGYVKKNLARRLGAAPLTPGDIERLERIFRRAVIRGTGLEEFGAYARLAGRLAGTGGFAGFEAWLVGTVGPSRPGLQTVVRACGSAAMLVGRDRRDWFHPAPDKVQANAWAMLLALRRRHLDWRDEAFWVPAPPLMP